MTQTEGAKAGAHRSWEEGAEEKGEGFPPSSEEGGASKKSEKGSVSRCFQNVQDVCKMSWKKKQNQ